MSLASVLPPEIIECIIWYLLPSDLLAAQQAGLIPVIPVEHCVEHQKNYNSWGPWATKFEVVDKMLPKYIGNRINSVRHGLGLVKNTICQTIRPCSFENIEYNSVYYYNGKLNGNIIIRDSTGNTRIVVPYFRGQVHGISYQYTSRGTYKTLHVNGVAIKNLAPDLTWLGRLP